MTCSPVVGRPERDLLSMFRALNTTIGKKFVIAITGLLLCGFLAFHLAGNLLMFVPAGEFGEKGAAYNAYAHGLHSMGPLLVVAEVALALLFLAHLYLAIRTTIDNTRARRVAYALKQSKQAHGVPLHPEVFMFWSGVFVLGFLILHIVDFAAEGRAHLPAPFYVDAYEHTVTENGKSTSEPLEPFEKALILLANPITATVYVIGCVALTIHLLHGFRSTFQSLGISHPTWNVVLQWLGVAFALVIGLGFVSFPILGFLGLL